MAAGFALLPHFPARYDAGLKSLLLGLGGGGLAMYISTMLPQVKQDALELDSAVVEAARRWFALDNSRDNLSVHIEDGLEFVCAKAEELKGKEDGRYDVILLDVDNKDTSVGVSCPSTRFLEIDFLENAKSILREDGLLIVNMVVRDSLQREPLLSKLRKVFPTLYSEQLSGSLSEIVYTFPVSADSSSACRVMEPESGHLSDSVRNSLERLHVLTKRRSIKLESQPLDLSSSFRHLRLYDHEIGGKR